MADKETVAKTSYASQITHFDLIVARKLPANIIYEDALVIAFTDIRPVAPTHFLVIPKDREGLSQLRNATPEHAFLLGHLMVVAAHVAQEQGLTNGFRTVINDGMHGCQTVYHLHIHVIGGKRLAWPPGVPPLEQQ